ncbi:hypothetical protein A2U01_0047360, partial [Trifolium medium]|nr:hypothetical protein [Trifolium medium]
SFFHYAHTKNKVGEGATKYVISNQSKCLHTY